jgi:NADH-quinone oxidoreductase subunit D
MNPYCSYDEFDFEVAVGTTGDVYDRFLVRNEEMKQSMRMIQQALMKIEKEDPSIFHADVPEFYLPPKQEVYNNMEALIYHFKIVMGEIETPVGEVYHSVEGANGELGFYLVNDGGRSPYRLHFRRPSFINYQMYAPMSRGMLLSDAIINMSSLNVIAGELDA